MKTAMRHVTVLLVFVVCGFKSAEAQTPEVAQLMREVQARYASLQTYSATGDVQTGITADGSSPILGGQSHEIRTTFTIRLARPQMYKIDWEQKMSVFVSVKGAVWSDGESRFVNVVGQVSQPKDTQTALAMATGVSSGAANTIPSIFFDLSSNSIAAASKHAMLAGEASIEGDNCYVVKTHIANGDRTFWISKTSKLIRQQMTVSASTNANLELTESDARNVLESMGQKVTDEAVRALRKQMASAQELMKSVKSYYSIETHREIKTDEPLSPGDFRDNPTRE
jgi:hypothetical protein